MTYVDSLRESRQSKASALHLFLLDFPKSTNVIHTFFEGNDDSSFYLNFIASLSIDKQIKAYKCGNKSAVYDVYVQVKKRITDSIKTLFFVDKDFSDILQEVWPTARNIYVTDFYSIENYLVTEQVLERVWTDIFHSPYNYEALERIKQNFNAKLNNFHKFMLPLIAWGLRDQENGGKPNLNNLQISKICRVTDELDLELINSKDALELFQHQCSLSIIREENIDDYQIFKALQLVEPKRYVRGKFELAFFVQYLNKLSNMLRGQTDQYGNTIKITTIISESNAVEILGPRLTIPHSLQQFLEDNLSNAA